MADNAQVPSSSEKPIHERQGEEAAKEQPKPDSTDTDTEKKSGSDDAEEAAPDEEKSADQDPDRKRETLAIAKGHRGDGNEGPGVKSVEEMKVAAEKTK